MENFLIILGVAVGALLLGILFIKRYDRIDRYFFGKIRRTVPGMNNDGEPTFRTVVENDSDYEPFGRMQVLASAVCGVALCVVLVGTSHFFGLGISDIGRRSLSLAVALVWAVILSYNLYEAIARMNSFGARSGKFVFLTVACAVGFGCGVLGSLLVVFAMLLYIIFLAVKIALRSSGLILNPGEILLDDGTVVRKRKGVLGKDKYEAIDSSDTYDRSGDTFTKRG